MDYLHVTIIEDTEECLVSYSEFGLRGQVTDSMVKRGIDGLSDEEW